MFGPDLGGLPVAASLLRVDPPGSPLPRAELVVEEEVVRDGVPDGGSGGHKIILAHLESFEYNTTYNMIARF